MPSPSPSDPVRARRRDADRAATRSHRATALSTRLAALLDDARRAAAALRRVEPARLAISRRPRSRGLSADEPILVADGERFKQLQTVARVYDALIRANADRASTLDHLRRRRHRRHRRLRRGDLSARHRARPRADDAAGPGGQRDRRQGRRQPPARQEPDRRVLPAARRRSSIRRCSARCRAANFAPDSTR